MLWVTISKDGMLHQQCFNFAPNKTSLNQYHFVLFPRLNKVQILKFICFYFPITQNQIQNYTYFNIGIRIGLFKVSKVPRLEE